MKIFEDVKPYVKVWKNPITLWKEFWSAQKDWEKFKDDNPEIKERSDAPMKPLIALMVQFLVIYTLLLIGVTFFV